MASADLNGDGRADMVVTGLSPSSNTSAIVGVYPNQGGSFITPTAYTVGSQAGPVVVGNFEGTGKRDIATVDPSNNQLFALLNDGSGNFSPGPGAMLGGSGGDSAIVAADFNGDGKDDVAVADPNDNQVVIAFSNGDGSFLVQSPMGVTDPVKVVAGDFNGDGHADLAILSGQSSSSVYIALNNGDGTFATPVAYSFGPGAASLDDLAAADFNGDGRPDLVAVGSSTSGAGIAEVLLTQSDGTLGSASEIALPEPGRAVVTGNFSNSGHADIAALGQSGSLDVLPGNGDGTFGADQSVFTSELATPGNQAIAADFDGNGAPDIAFLSRSQGGIATLLNGVATSAVTPELTGKLPGKPLVAGGRIAPLSQVLSFTASSAFSGKATVNLQLVPVNGFSSAGSTIDTVTRAMSLKAGRGLKMLVAIRSLPAGLDGSYYLIANLTDSTGAVSTAAAEQPVTVVPPTIDLSGAFVTVPRAGRVGRRAIVSFKITNSGSITASGTLPVEIFASTTGSLDASAVSVANFTRRIAIGAGKTIRMQAVTTLPSSAAAYYLVGELDPQNTLNDVNLSNNIFASATTISLS
ncbi:MAG TPA: VCBS repeat-containing protein [Thermoplasmata archaeon]|nr:VCBS repeat-containing protein [Thermoplasmata archaeon]